MAGRHDQLAGVAGSAVPNVLGSRNARIDLAICGIHRELMHFSLRHAWLHGHFGRRLVRRTNDKVPLGIDRRNFAVRQFFRLDKTWRVRIAGRRLRPLGHGESIDASDQKKQKRDSQDS